MYNIEGYEPALWKYTNRDGSFRLDNVFINGDMLYINRDGDTITVSNDGKVKEIIHISNSSGYLAVRVKPYKPGKFDDFGLYCVHQLVVYTFVGLPPIDMVCPSIEHRNQRRLDNNINNLCWMEKKENLSNRLQGSRNERDLKRIGQDAKYCIRDTKRLRADVKRRDNDMLDEYYWQDEQDFLDKYR